MQRKNNAEIKDTENQVSDVLESNSLNTLTYSSSDNTEGLSDRVDLLETVMEHFPGGIVLFDTHLNMVLCNDELKRLLEYPDSLFASGLPSMKDLFQFNAERGEYGEGDVKKMVKDKLALVNLATAHCYERERPNGTVLEVRGVPLKNGGFLTTYVDVTDQRHRIHQLEALLDNFPGGISLFDKHLKMVLFNDKLKQLHGYPNELFENGMPTLEDIFRFNAERGEYGAGEVEEHVSRRMDLAKQNIPHTYDRKRPNGVILEVRGVPLAGSGFLTTYRDVTEHRESQEKIAYMAHHDALTDLPNRLLFQDRLKHAIAQAERGYNMALHCIDLDKFKPVNDNYGHAVGDQLLKQVAERFRSIKRDTDTIARVGGDEFMLIQVGITDREGARTLADRVIETLSHPYEIDGHVINIGASIGIALAPEYTVDQENLVKMADAALYDSKAAGRGCFNFHTG
ncbi:MAG: PAS-domain containing protein [Rhizobiaceae bacterium]|nr:PAS-domain containing protein [Rhizobiaceae bacterium]